MLGDHSKCVPGGAGVYAHLEEKLETAVLMQCVNILGNLLVFTFSPTLLPTLSFKGLHMIIQWSLVCGWNYHRKGAEI